MNLSPESDVFGDEKVFVDLLAPPDRLALSSTCKSWRTALCVTSKRPIRFIPRPIIGTIYYKVGRVFWTYRKVIGIESNMITFFIPDVILDAHCRIITPMWGDGVGREGPSAPNVPPAPPLPLLGCRKRGGHHRDPSALADGTLLTSAQAFHEERAFWHLHLDHLHVHTEPLEASYARCCALRGCG